MPASNSISPVSGESPSQFATRLKQKIEQMDRSQPLVFAAGSYPACKFSGLEGTAAQPIVLQGAPNHASVIDGSLGSNGQPTNGSHDEAFKLQNSSHMHLVGLRVTRGQHGLRILGCEHLEIRECLMNENRIEGLVFGAGCEHVLVEACQMLANRGPGDAAGDHYPEDKAHGLYVSNGKNLVVRRCRILSNTGAGIHLKGDPITMTGVTVEGCILRRNGTAGTPGILLASCDGLELTGCLLVDNRAGIAGHSEAGAASATFSRCTVYHGPGPHRWGVKSISGSDIALERCIVLSGDGTSDGDQALITGNGSVLSVDNHSLVFEADQRAQANSKLQNVAGDDFTSLVAGVGWPVT